MQWPDVAESGRNSALRPRSSCASDRKDTYGMSGTPFMSSEGSEEIDTKWNPLHCHLCHEQYKDPCILQCYHSFCLQCLNNRVDNGRLACPLCETVTIIKEDDKRPASDALLKFLVESASGDKVPCANCDQVQPQMYFCSTCSQSLCVPCREETHSARMFQTHEILLQTKHTRDIQKQCGVHKEPYILFSTEKKVMLCINCFRDMKVESRSHCVDLETAYKQGCQKLDDTMQSIRDLQNSCRDGILLLRALLEEIESNVEKEKGEIQHLYDTVQEKISETRESLLAEIDRQYAEKVELFKNQLVSLTTFLPTLRVHLVTCAAFSSSANKYEFLDFTYVLMKRLMSIIQVQHPLHPSQTSDIVTDYKAKFAKCLEPLLFPHRNGVTVSVANPIVPNVACTRYDVSPCIISPAVSIAGIQSQPQETGDQGQQNGAKTLQQKKKFKLKLMETKGFFADHCKEFDTSHREFMKGVESIKQSVQELQRDITLRRSLTREVTIRELQATISQTEESLAAHQGNTEAKQGGLEKHWEESLERIAAEQEVYQAQLQDVARLKTEVASVKVILQKLSSFVTSIASVTQRLAPKLSKATLAAEQDSTHAAILQEISTRQPDSQHRVDAISKAEEDRDIRTANRVNPLDEELIKTKGLLRAPSLRKESSIKRLSAEIKDVKIETGEKEKRMSGEIKDIKIETDETDEKEKIGKDKDKPDDVYVETKTEIKNDKEMMDVGNKADESLNVMRANKTNGLEVNSSSSKEHDQAMVENGNGETYKRVSTAEGDDHSNKLNEILRDDSAIESVVKQESNKSAKSTDVCQGNGSVHVLDENCDKEFVKTNQLADSRNNSQSQSNTGAAQSSQPLPNVGAKDVSQTLPDIMTQVDNILETGKNVRDQEVNETTPDIDVGKDMHVPDTVVGKGITEKGEINAEFTLEITSSDISGSESDFNTSTESYQSSEEGVKPGLVKDLVALVDKRVKPLSVNITDTSDSKASASKSPKIRVTEGELKPVKKSVSDENNDLCDGKDSNNTALSEKKDVDADSVTNSFCQPPDQNGSLHKQEADDQNDSNDIGKSSENDSSLGILGGVAELFGKSPDTPNTTVGRLNNNISPVGGDSASADDDEVYVAKSLPELAQVFEPGELKQKRKKSRSARSKDQNNT